MSSNFLKAVEISRRSAQDHISEEKKKLEEQYFTPPRIAIIMAKMFTVRPNKSITVLDPCSGVGNLAAALFEEGNKNSEHQKFTLIEKDEYLSKISSKNFHASTDFRIINGDFFEKIITEKKFDRIILNPPYAKIKSGSKLAKLCKENLGYSDNNLYSVFISFCLAQLSKNGELVGIIPRSFCNGPLFLEFRKFLLNDFYIHELYTFSSRNIFSDSGIKQEVVIIKISKEKGEKIKVSNELNSGNVRVSEYNWYHIIFPNDNSKVIHVPSANDDELLLSKISVYKFTLIEYGLKTSTGKVVDFRCFRILRKTNKNNSVPLIYQDNIRPGSRINLKANIQDGIPRFIARNALSEKLFLGKGNYILIRRISFKESPTRIVSSLLLEDDFLSDVVAIENHVNYIWSTKGGLSRNLCIGLYGYLGTVTIDSYVRRFSGHTQINAADINSLPIPEFSKLEEFGEANRETPLHSLFRAAEEFFFIQSTS